MEPQGKRNNNHLFSFTNFKHDMVSCSVCNKYLLGIFYQGYKCDHCSQVAHKDCLTKTPVCTMHNQTSSLTHNHMFRNSNKNLRINSMSSPHSPSDITVVRSMSVSSCKQLQQPFCVRAIYKYDGRPDPPELPVLKFNEGDLIQVS